MQISNAATGAVLDTETISSFSSGVYLEWAVSGNVLITITQHGGPNAVLSGLFLDPTPTPTSIRSTPSDGRVHPEGHDDAGELDRDLRHPGLRRHRQRGQPAQLRHHHALGPVELHLDPEHDQPRALQDAGGTGRIAACWYAPTSFTVAVNLTDGQAHDLELYFFDYDGSKTRSEQVQISNASTGAVLDTESISSFSSGVYLEWAVKGNILITITCKGGPNAVLSGLFLDPASVSTASTISSLTATAVMVEPDATSQGSGSRPSARRATTPSAIRPARPTTSPSPPLGHRPTPGLRVRLPRRPSRMPGRPVRGEPVNRSRIRRGRGADRRLVGPLRSLARNRVRPPLGAYFHRSGPVARDFLARLFAGTCSACLG